MASPPESQSTDDAPASDEHRVVVGVDGSESSQRALVWAADYAAHTHATLEVVTTWELPTSYGWTLAFPTGFDPAGEAAKMLEGMVEPVRKKHPHLHVRSRTVEGHPAPVLVTASKGADLLVVGSRGHGEFVGMLLGSVSEYLATMAHCPVVVHRATS